MAAAGKGKEAQAASQEGQQAEQFGPRTKVRAGMLYALEATAVVFGALIIVFQYLINPLFFFVTTGVWGMILLAAGLGLGAVAVFLPPPKVASVSALAKKKNPGIKEIMAGISIGLFITGLILSGYAFQDIFGEEGLRYLITFENILSNIWLIYIMLLAVSFLMYVELTLSSFRFAKIKQYAEMQGLQDLELNSAITGNLVKGIGAGFATLIIIFPILLVLQLVWGDWTPEVIRKSIEFNSIYGLVLLAGAIFGIIAVIYSFIFGWETYQKQIRTFRKEEEEEEGA